MLFTSIVFFTTIKISEMTLFTVQMIQTAWKSGKPRNAVFQAYFQQKISEGKTKPQALVCVMRRLVNIIYGMLKNKTEYRAPEL